MNRSYMPRGRGRDDLLHSKFISSGGFRKSINALIRTGALPDILDGEPHIRAYMDRVRKIDIDLYGYLRSTAMSLYYASRSKIDEVIIDLLEEEIWESVEKLESYFRHDLPKATIINGQLVWPPDVITDDYRVEDNPELS